MANPNGNSVTEDAGNKHIVLELLRNTKVSKDAFRQSLANLAWSDPEFDIFELFELTLNFHSESSLEAYALEYEPLELYDGVKKTIAARILGIKYNSASEEANEDKIIATLDTLGKKYLESISEVSNRATLDEIQAIVMNESEQAVGFAKIREVIGMSNLGENIRDEILFERVASTRPIVTPPPKCRGRPKKAQASSSNDSNDETKRQQVKSREVHFVFFSIVRYMFRNCASYLKNTRSRVLINHYNPLADKFETDLIKGTTQRASRSKTGSQQSETHANLTKKMKLEPEKTTSVCEESPLNSVESRSMDSRILASLIEVNLCLDFLNSNYGSFTKLWQRFLASSGAVKLQWYRRITVDSMLISGQYEIIAEQLENIFEVGQETVVTGEKQQEHIPNSAKGGLPVKSIELRNLVQLVSCYSQLLDKTSALQSMSNLLSRLRQCGLLSEVECYSSHNMVHEYMINIKHDEKTNLSFLFFDPLSIIRYCTSILMSILKRFVSNSSLSNDTAIGHMIVLSQFDWPKESAAYDQCISWLRVQKPKSTTPQCISATTKFTYPDFFKHIKNPNIIEDFMAMLSQGYTLDIKSTSSDSPSTTSLPQTRAGGSVSQNGPKGVPGNSLSRSGKAITTRGVNKTFKEDLKVALVAQMKNSSAITSIDSISSFIQLSLIPYLSSLSK